MMGHVVSTVSKRLDGAVTCVRIDCDKYPALASKYKVQALPTLVLFKDGKPIDKVEVSVFVCLTSLAASTGATLAVCTREDVCIASGRVAAARTHAVIRVARSCIPATLAQGATLDGSIWLGAGFRGAAAAAGPCELLSGAADGSGPEVQAVTCAGIRFRMADWAGRNGFDRERRFTGGCWRQHPSGYEAHPGRCGCRTDKRV